MATNKDITFFNSIDYKSLAEEEFRNFIFPNYLEYEYTKEDLFNYYNVQNDKSITDTPQVWGGSFFVKKCNFSLPWKHQ